MECRVLEEMLDATSVEGTGPPDDPVNLKKGEEREGGKEGERGGKENIDKEGTE